MQDFINGILSNSTMVSILIVTLGIVLIIVLTRIVKKILSRRVKSDNWYKAKKAVNASGYVLAVILILIVYNDRLSGVTVALGVAGAGIAFALQEVITSIAGWVAITVGGFYKTGDRVQVGGIKGDVIDQGILRTTVMELGEWVDGDLYNGRIVRIANSFVFKEPVYNYSADFPFLWDEIKVPIKFGSDYKLARTIIKKAADSITGEYAGRSQARWDDMVRKYSIENATLETMVSMKITDNWVEYTLRYVVDYRKRRSTKNAIFNEILNEVMGSNGLVELGSTTINITEFPAIKVMNKEKN